MPSEPIGIIGGSGLYQMDGLKLLEEIKLTTPFGEPSDAFLKGEFSGSPGSGSPGSGQPVVFLSRHGRGHRISPSEINFRANIWGMKKLGVVGIIAVSAVGSLKKEVVPGHMVIVDQFIDRTRGRVSTFFTEGVVAHITFADPFCQSLRKVLIQAGHSVGATVHEQGTYVCMEGPQFSTRAESNLYRQWGADVIGMTNLQEAKLAREAELCYATIALSTDYDCWYEGHEDVTIGAVLEVLQKNVATAQNMIRWALSHLVEREKCECGKALAHAILTDRKLIPEGTKKKLEVIAGKYL